MTRMTDQLRMADDYMSLLCGCEAGTVDGAFLYRPHALDCEAYRYIQELSAQYAKPLRTHVDPPVSGCVECGDPNDDFTAINNDTKPHEGAISICANCGHLAAFTGDGLALRELTTDELIEVRANPEVIAALRQIGRRSEFDSADRSANGDGGWSTHLEPG